MTCDIYTKDGKAVMFLCNRSKRRPKCSCCGKPAVKLCDFPLAGKKEGQTCDKNLCAICATEVDVDNLPERFQLSLHEKGSELKISAEFDPDTVDVCPAHARFIRAKDTGK